MAGVGGQLVRLAGFHPSPHGPHFCNMCEDRLPPGGAEIDIAVLFADVRGSTALGERLGSGEFAALLNRFYKTATEVLVDHKAMIDKLVGDQVMALFFPALTGPEYRKVAVEAAKDLMQSVGYRPGQEAWLPLGAAVHAGQSFMGKVGTNGVYSFTALGDPVNVASRLQSQAAAGELILSEEIYQSLGAPSRDYEQRTVEVRGKEQPMSVRVLHPGLSQTRVQR